MSVNPLEDNLDDDNQEIDIEIPVDTGKREIKIIEKGWQPLVIKSAVKSTSNSGNPQVEIEFTSGGRKTKEWYSLLPTAVWKIAAVVMATDPSIKPGDKLKLNLDKLIGKQLMGEIAHERSGEYTNAKVKKVKPHPDGPEPSEDNLPF
jgi:hypothetical protein